MENLNDIESIYKHLEKNATIYRYPHQIGELFKNIRDLYQKEKKFDEAEKAQWEIDFFHFMLEEGELKPFMTWTNDKGELVELPSLKNFSEKTYKYLDGRLNTTSNPLLKARYAHIFWFSPKKHAKYAKFAVDSYLELVKIYEGKEEKNPQENYGIDVINTIKNAFYIGCRTKYRIDEIKSEIIKLIKEFNFESSSAFALRFELINLMLDEKRIFIKKDFQGIENIFWQLAESLIKEGNSHTAIDMLEQGEKIDSKIEKKTHNWRRKIAECYEALMTQSGKSKNLATLYFCQQALENYKKVKESKKISEIEKKYNEIKGSMKFAEFKQEIDLSEHIKRCKEIAEKISQEDSEKIIKLLMLDKQILPGYKDMKKRAGDLRKKSVVRNLIPEVIIDQSGHPAQHFSEDSEKKYLAIIQQYQMELEIVKIHLIREIFFYAIKNKKLSSEILLRFLNKNSWYGKNLLKKLGDGMKIKYNWLNLLAPSINEYFTKMHYFFLNPVNYPNLVLAIDSLTLKIEGLIRDICRFSGTPTFFLKKDKKGRTVVQEKDLHALLYEDKIKELFDEDDLLFFKYLLVEKAGLNLRHRIAHSLLYFQEYNLDIMHLLIIALLRIGKYDFVKEDKQEGK